MTLAFASLCTGGGLADVGAKLAGCELAWGIELNPAIADVASASLGHPVTVGSITEVNPSDFERPDILWTSPPCPNFSVAKKDATETAEDLAIAQSVIGFIQTLKPRYVFLENVEGYRKSKSFRAIQEALNVTGYWSNWQVLNAADYGVPQARRRLILRAVLGGFLPPLPAMQPWGGWHDAIADLIPSLPESQFAPWQLKLMPRSITGRFLASGLNQTIRAPTILAASEPSPTVTASTLRRPCTAPLAVIVDDQKSGKSKRLTIRDANEPVFTVVSRSASKVRAQVDRGRVVSMTPRALARFQTLPDWYGLPNSVQLASRIIGNGVPCELAKQLIEGVAA